MSVLGNGGALVYAMLSRLGFSPEYNFIGIERAYGKSNGKTDISYSITKEVPPNSRIVDDVIASGSTVNFAIKELGINRPDMLALVMSGDTRNQYREEEGSTVRNVERVYAAKSVDYRGGFPAIFSARFLLKKVKEGNGYRRYLSKYVDGRVDEVAGLLKGVETGPLDLLYREPETFIKEFGGE
ncbi:MAG: phosphoribosyltransferase [Candidatus Aenigmatarchaeota archaeon]